jgi:alkylation response protein AidB-like acyl-CoA dehydrogenase
MSIVRPWRPAPATPSALAVVLAPGRAAPSRLMLYTAECSCGPGGSSFPDPALAVQAKILASEAAIKIVSDALQVFGARDYSRDFPLERMARDVRMFTIGGGTAQVLRTLVASKILGWKLPQTRDGYMMSKPNVDRD